LRAHAEYHPAESWQDLLDIRKRFLQEWQPQTLDQRRLVARVACAEWKLLQWRATQPRSQSRLRGGASARQARLEHELREAYDKLAKSMPSASPQSRPAA
jgi:hypothetical protein